MSASTATLLGRLQSSGGRVLRDASNIEQRVAERRPLYEDVAKVTIDTGDLTLDETVTSLVGAVAAMDIGTALKADQG